MCRTLPNPLNLLFLFWLCFQAAAFGQEPASGTRTREVTSWIPLVEQKFQVAFSYASDDELDNKLSQISAATGLQLSGQLPR